MVLGNLIGGFIVIVVGTSLMPIVADLVVATQLSTGNTSTNVTGAAATLLDLTTLFFALAVMSAAIALGVATLRQSGLI